jgi:hypothetical protein
MTGAHEARGVSAWPPRVDPAFLRAVVDTLLPGDEGTPPLPVGTAIGVGERLAARVAGDRDADAHVALLGRVARWAGSEAAFLRMDGAARADTLRAVEAETREDFARLVTLALEEYYESEPVILAMGWRVQSPQPLGHPVQPLDDALLDPVRRRGRMWRDAGGR